MNPGIKNFALFCMMFLLVRGVTFFTLPSLVTSIYGTNSWTVIPIYIMIMVGLMYILIKGIERHGNQSIFDLLEHRFPSYIAKPISFIIIVNFLGISITIIHEYVSMFQFTLDSSVNVSNAAFFLILAVLIVAGHGLYTMSKASILLFIVSFWIIGIEVLLFSDFSFTRLSPFFFKGGNFEWHGALRIAYSFYGFELLLIIYPHLGKQTKVFRATTWSYVLLCIYYTIYTILSQGLVSFLQIPKIRFITLRLYGASRFPTVEYITDFIFFFFIFSTIISSAAYVWSANEGILKTITKKFPLGNYLLIGVCYTILVSLNLSIDDWMGLSFFVGLVETFIIVFCILLIWILPKAKNGQNSHNPEQRSSSWKANEQEASSKEVQ
ncbi:GerAB/ArcD/ProY family transporter [Paenibacillus sp. 1001270B_150601_E10]|uniref:GerAB/ArcD/ProY family transporter n=1 Tax=Paenibacillus sp. 1001270B_150601_E10 TaxID=2787079 RepID=UPI00189E0ACD|nr:GerAB/ArcD/ProY family transporter [Paenibacillus sp. 1001270B_150601_E10]